MKKIKYVLFVLGLSLLSACKDASLVSVEKIYQSQFCYIDKPTIEVLDGSGLKKVVDTAHSFKLEKVDSVVSIEKEEVAILVAWGTKANSGYRLALRDTQAKVIDGELQLDIDFIEPQPGMNTAQVLTSPCLILKARNLDALQKVSALPLGSFNIAQ